MLSSPAWLTGLTDSDLSLTRHNWVKRHHAGDLDRLQRLQKAVVDSQRAGELDVHFVDMLTDPALVAKADASARKAADALAALKARKG